MNPDNNLFTEETLQKRYDLRLLRRLMPFAARYKTFFLGSIFLVTLITLLDLAIPIVYKIAIDRFIVPGTIAHSSLPAKNPSGTSRHIRIQLLLPEHQAVLEKYPDLFEQTGNEATIDYGDLNKLAPQDARLLRKQDLSGIAGMAVLIVMISVTHFVFTFLQAMMMELNGQKIMHDLRVQLFDHIQRLEFSFFTRNPVGRLVTRVTNDIQNMHEMFTTVVTFVFKDLFLLAGISIVLLSRNIQLALISLMALPAVIFTAYKFADVARDAFRTLRIKVAEINTHFSETIQGIGIIQLFRNEAGNKKQFQTLNHENFRAGMRQVKIFAVFMPFIELMGSFTLAVLIYYGGSRVIRQAISLGDLVAFIFYMRMFFRPIRDIAEKFNVMQNAMASAERIFLILDTPLAERADSSAANQMALNTIASVEFRQVAFAYIPGEPILRDINFRLEAGESLAIVGPTGAGKTSLVNLLVGFYPPERGSILINGKQMADFPLHLIRSRIALVSQDPFLFSSTIRDNILPSDRQISDKDLQHLLSNANCLDFIQRLPDGLDTMLSEGGASLSSGERQLISIARALAHDPDLIILDEATSYIDSESEHQIQGAMDTLMAGRTSIVIAHRISTAQKADRIISLHQGNIIEAGTHQELMTRKGLYFKLHQLQN
jgi:ATP-binding cassette subfamily B multidrug efflux pump